MKDYVILLATDDPAVEAAAREVSLTAECGLHCVNNSREALSLVMDGSWDQDVAVVDLDSRRGSRSLLRTAGGACPVIAITAKTTPWLTRLLRHRRIGAALTKPVSPQNLRDAFHWVRSQCSVVELRRSGVFRNE